ncbi:DUF2818 family protein [Paenalcaligenes sp. Me131]|uniref:DUF2818 family protein n=1 Tax=Paenalcaligenes sp. Me131 TaxID=3392636 RepID=UPI003D2A5F36
MGQGTAVWVLIALAFITANLPFLIQRPLFCMPWRQVGEAEGATAVRLLRFVVMAALVAAAAYASHDYISRAFFNSSTVLLLTVAAVVVVFAVLMWLPGFWLRSQPAIEKGVITRLIEFVILFVLMGVLGFAFEASQGNVFPQRWEFYAIGLCLYVVLGYPGFVFRYLVKRRRGVASMAADGLY